MLPILEDISFRDISVFEVFSALSAIEIERLVELAMAGRKALS